MVTEISDFCIVRSEKVEVKRQRTENFRLFYLFTLYFSLLSDHVYQEQMLLSRTAD